MRTVEYELWQTEKRDEDGKVEREEERIGARRELFSKTPFTGGEVTGHLREEILQKHLDEIAERKLKFSEVEVRARPFPA